MKHLLKTNNEYKNLKKLEIIYQNELDKACFQHDTAYKYFKDCPRGTGSDKVLRDKVFNIAKNPKYDGYHRGLASMVYIFFDEKSSGSNTSGGAIKNKIISNQQLDEDLHKPITRRFEKTQSKLFF